MYMLIEWMEENGKKSKRMSERTNMLFMMSEI